MSCSRRSRCCPCLASSVAFLRTSRASGMFNTALLLSAAVLLAVVKVPPKLIPLLLIPELAPHGGALRQVVPDTSRARSHEATPRILGPRMAEVDDRHRREAASA